MPRISSRISAQTGAATSSPGAFPLERTGSRAGDDAQTKARGATLIARSGPDTDGNLIVGQTMFAGTPVSISHMLGRKAVGAYPKNIIATTPPAWCTTSLGDAKTGQITVKVDQDCVIDWWIF